MLRNKTGKSLELIRILRFSWCANNRETAKTSQKTAKIDIKGIIR